MSNSVLVCGLLAWVTGCVTTGQGNLIKADIKKLQDAVKALETGTYDQKVRFEKLVDEANKHIERVRALIKESTDFLAKNNAAFGAEMDQVKQSISKLSGKIEEVAHGIGEWKKEYADFKAVVSKQIGNISEGLPVQMPDTPEGLLEEAAKRFKAYEIQTARRLWEIFLARYPTHEKVALTQYWIAESLFRERNYERAVQEYEKVRKKSPQSDVMPAALWGIALSFHELGEKDLALAAANELIKAYPDNDLAKQAKKRLKEFKKGKKVG